MFLLDHQFVVTPGQSDSARFKFLFGVFSLMLSRAKSEAFALCKLHRYLYDDVTISAWAGTIENDLIDGE